MIAMLENMFAQVDFGNLQMFLDNDDVTDISYSNGGQIWLKTLSKGIFRVEVPNVNNAFMEKLAFQCANAMGKSFNMAHPFLDAESAELRLNFVHDSIAKNGIAAVLRKTPAKVRLEHNKIIADKYITEEVHDLLIKCVLGHCNIIVCGETGSGKTEFVKYLASKTKENEKIITIEDTLELHLDRIFPHRDIVAMKTNNIASYSDVLVTCMRQNPKWILLSEVRSAEAVLAVRNSISSGHYILSTIHADKAASIPSRMYSLLETNQDIDQFLASIHRYIQIGVMIRGYQNKVTKKFVREIAEVTEFYVDNDNNARSNVIYKKDIEGRQFTSQPTKHLIDYLEGQGIILNVASQDGSQNNKQVNSNINQPVNQNINRQVSNSNINRQINNPSVNQVTNQNVTNQNVNNQMVNRLANGQVRPNINQNVGINQNNMQNIPNYNVSNQNLMYQNNQSGLNYNTQFNNQKNE